MQIFFNKIKVISLIILKDLKESLKNRTAIMIILLPLFASLMFSLVSGEQLMRNFNLGISGEGSEEIAAFIDDNFQNFNVNKYSEAEAGRQDTASGNIDAALIYYQDRENIEDRYQIYLDSRDTINFLF